jgi:hypothetical protein
MPRRCAWPPRRRAGRVRWREPFCDSSKKHFVGLGNPAQQRRAVGAGQCQEAVTPAERGVAVHAELCRGLAHRVRGQHAVQVAQPALLVMQPGQRRAGQRIEGFAAGAAAVALHTAFTAMPVPVSAGAARAAQLCLRGQVQQAAHLPPGVCRSQRGLNLRTLQVACQRRILFRKFAAQIMQGGQFALVVWQQSLHFQELQGNTAIKSCVLEF